MASWLHPLLSLLTSLKRQELTRQVAYARSRKRKIDCNDVYRLLDEGLWWPILENKRLAIVSGHTDEFAARLMDPNFVRATSGGEITWSVATKVTCPPVHEPKRSHWLRMRDELFSTSWNLLLCSAAALSAMLCDQSRDIGRKRFDIGALDYRLIEA